MLLSDEVAVLEFERRLAVPARCALDQLADQLAEQHGQQAGDDDDVERARAAEHQPLVDALRPDVHGVRHARQHHADDARDECAAPRPAEQIADDARRETVHPVGIDDDLLRLVGHEAAERVDHRAGDQRRRDAARTLLCRAGLDPQVDAQRKRDQRAADVECKQRRDGDVRQKSTGDDQRDEQQRLPVGQTQLVQYALADAEQQKYARDDEQNQTYRHG